MQHLLAISPQLGSLHKALHRKPVGRINLPYRTCVSSVLGKTQLLQVHASGLYHVKSEIPTCLVGG